MEHSAKFTKKEIKNLLEKAKNTEVTEEFVDNFNERFEKREKMFKEQHKKQTPTHEWYNRGYDL